MRYLTGFIFLLFTIFSIHIPQCHAKPVGLRAVDVIDEQNLRDFEEDNFANTFSSDSQIEVTRLDEIGSTQTYAIQNLENKLQVAGDWYIVTANSQTDGIGQHGRKWESSCSGNIYASFATLIPKSLKEEILQSTQVSAYSVWQTLDSLGLNPKIKWINDVIVDGKKISGCICDVVPATNEDFVYLIIGIGINVNMSEEQLNSLPNDATSVVVQLGKECDKEALFQLLTDNLKKNIFHLMNGGYSTYELAISDLLITRDDPDSDKILESWTLKESRGDWKKKIPIKGGHKKNVRPSTKNKHQVADARRQAEQRKAAQKKQGNKKRKKNR